MKSSGLLTTLAALGIFLATPSSDASAQSAWFYDHYQAYENDAFGPDEPFGYDEYIEAPGYYIAPPRWLRKLRRRARLRRWIRRQQYRAAARARRQTLFEARRRDRARFNQPVRDLPYPRRKLARRKTVAFAKVPLPRPKPANRSLPPLAGTQPVPALDKRPAFTAAIKPQTLMAAKPAPKAETKPRPVVRKSETPRPPKSATSDKTLKVASIKAPRTKQATKRPAIPPLRIEVQPRTPPGAISCTRAKSIITGFGFSSITGSSCSGKVYSFDASRDGKPFRIRLSAKSGELVEVKRR